MSYLVRKRVFPHLRILSTFLIFLFTGNSFSQEPRALLLEPEFEVIIPTETDWSYSFGLANRGILVETIQGVRSSNYDNEHIELNHYTIYAITRKSELSFGMRYRFQQAFDEERTDEVRLIQQFYSENTNMFIGWWHRARFEQRFQDNATTFRLRYEFGLSKPINEVFSLELATESLYSVSRQSKPEPEQRLELGVENTSFDKWEIYLGLEYRRDNYVRNPENELFILTAASLNL